MWLSKGSPLLRSDKASSRNQEIQEQHLAAPSGHPDHNPSRFLCLVMCSFLRRFKGNCGINPAWGEYHGFPKAKFRGTKEEQDFGKQLQETD